jgi:hypothetical protein
MFFADKLGPLPQGIRGAPAGGEPVDPKTGQAAQQQQTHQPAA